MVKKIAFSLIKPQSLTRQSSVQMAVSDVMFEHGELVFGSITAHVGYSIPVLIEKRMRGSSIRGISGQIELQFVQLQRLGA